MTERPAAGGALGVTTTTTEVIKSIPPATLNDRSRPQRAVYDQDLFGEACPQYNERIPRKNSRDYLTYIAALPLHDGLEVWSLAEPPPKGVPPYVESIWCIDRQRRHWRLLVDLRTGEKYEPNAADDSGESSRES